MNLVTILWSMVGAAALTLGIIHGLAWLLDRRNIPSLMFSVIAFAIASFARFDLGMMFATTPTEYGEWLRWYYLPGFIFNAGCVLFVLSFLGAGRVWLAWTIICLRLLVLIANVLSHPSFAYQTILSLHHTTLFGQSVAVVGDAVVRPTQWLMSATMPLFLAFILDATIQCWRRGGTESRRKAIVVGLGIEAPLLTAWVVWHTALLGLTNIPLLYTPLLTITLAAIAFELSRASAASWQSQLEIAELRAELWRASRVSALGQLASGLAHELSQPLGAILRNTEAALVYLDTGTPDLKELRAMLTDIQQDDTRAGEVIDRMRALISRRTIETQSLVVADLVSDVISVLHSEAQSRHVQLDSAIDPRLPRVWGGPRAGIPGSAEPRDERHRRRGVDRGGCQIREHRGRR